MLNINFFKPQGPFNLEDLTENAFSNEGIKIFDIKTLENASNKDITFLNSPKYKNQAITTKAAACITKKNLENFLPKKCIKVFVKNVLFSTAKISLKFYPKADLDYPDVSVVDSTSISNKYNSVTSVKIF